MIPKIIHYCWLSDEPYPEKIQKCLNSWKEKLPDYEIWLWNLNRFDINSSVWVKEAYENKKYAFAADYIRFYALYNYGGIYLDSDVEVLKSYDDLLNLPYFMGYEYSGCVEAATMGAEKGHPLYKAMLDYYKNRHFIKENGEQDIIIVPKILMSMIQQCYDVCLTINSVSDFKNEKGVLCVFTNDFFSPIVTSGYRYTLKCTTNTYSIHHFASAWVSWQVKLLVFLFGYTTTMLKVKSFLSFIQRTFYKKPKMFFKKIIG